MSKLAKLAIYSFRLNDEGQRIIDPFIVPTPSPYIVDLGSYTREEKGRRIEKLLSNVQYLREVLTSLGCSEQEAYERDYSLNRKTWDELYSHAMQQKNHKITKMMRERGSF